MFKTQVNAAKAAAFQLTERAVTKSLPAFTITRNRGFLPREVSRKRVGDSLILIEQLFRTPSSSFLQLSHLLNPFLSA